MYRSFFLFAAVAAIGCATDDDAVDTGTPEVETLAIVGDYTDEWGTEHTITDAQWSDSWGLVFHIVSFDNDAGVIIAHNAPENEFDGDLWSQFNWAESGDALYYCQVVYNAASQDDAEAAPMADASALTTDGCGGFAWTNLTP